MEKADSRFKRGKDLVSRLAKAFSAGVTIDSLLCILTKYIPKLAESTRIPVPGYRSEGIPWDDVIGQSIPVFIIGYGIGQKSLKTILSGATMAAAELFISQYQ